MTADASQVYGLAADLNMAGDRAELNAQRVVARTAFAVQASGQRNAPVDTGFLRSSISTDLRGLEAEVGPTANYGHYVEFGTSRMAPQPYMGPAADEHADAFAEGIAQAGGDVL